ncbi:MAG: DUF1573 domain-containing protein [Planctomycetes bacterium]|jgi:hypothetical protein|nr:DUF1573 domain-containing protein [Planctomycetota bacterium]
MRSTVLIALAAALAACASLSEESGTGGPRTPSGPAASGTDAWTPGRTATPGGTIDPDPGFPGAAGVPGPRLVFTADGHDFGLQEKNAKVEHTAIFYNTGDAPLEIGKVITHCGCAAALLSSRTIPPGGRGTMRVVLDTGGLAGDRVKRVEVYTNDPTHPISVYPISCTVIADAALDPLQLVLRTTRSAGDVKAHFDVLNLRGDFDLSISGVTVSNPQIRAEVGPIPPGSTEKRGYRVNLTFGPDFGVRDFSEKVTVFTNSRRDPQLVLVVIGSVREAVLVVPERLWFPVMAPGTKMTREVFVYRNDGKSLTITEVKDPSGLFETEKTRVEPGKWKVTLKIHGEVPRQTVRGALIIRTDDPKEPVIDLPFEVPGGGAR